MSVTTTGDYYCPLPRRHLTLLLMPVLNNHGGKDVIYGGKTLRAFLAIIRIPTCLECGQMNEFNNAPCI